MIRSLALGLALALALAPILLASCAKAPVGQGAEGLVVRLGYVKGVNPSLAIVALAKGFFAAEGIEVKPRLYAFGKLALAAVTKGEADLATAAETPSMFAILGGEKIAIAAVISSTGKNTILVAVKAAGVEKPGDLAGKTIGLAKGTTGEYFLDTFLVAQGIDGRSVKILDMQPEAMLGEMEAGRVDAVVAWNPYSMSIVSALGDRALVMYGDEVYTENFCIVGEQEFLRKNPVAMKRFMRALLRAEDFVRKEPSSALAANAAYTKTDESSLLPVWDLHRLRLTLDQSLLLILEDEARWAMRAQGAGGVTMPNFLEYIDADALSSVAPERVRLIR